MHSPVGTSQSLYTFEHCLSSVARGQQRNWMMKVLEPERRVPGTALGNEWKQEHSPLKQAQQKGGNVCHLRMPHVAPSTSSTSQEEGLCGIGKFHKIMCERLRMSLPIVCNSNCLHAISAWELPTSFPYNSSTIQEEEGQDMVCLASFSPSALQATAANSQHKAASARTSQQGNDVAQVEGAAQQAEQAQRLVVRGGLVDIVRVVEVPVGGVRVQTLLDCGIGAGACSPEGVSKFKGRN